MGAGRGGPAGLVAGPHLRRRSRRRAATRPAGRGRPRGGRRRRRAPPAAGRHLAPTVRRSAARSPSAAVGFGAFLASHRRRRARVRLRPSSSAAAASSTPVPPTAGTVRGSVRQRRGERRAVASRRRDRQRSGSRTGGLHGHRRGGRRRIPTLEQVHQGDRASRSTTSRPSTATRSFFTAQLSGPLGRGSADRVGHRRHDRLDDRPAHPPRLAGDASTADAELPGEPARHLPRPLVRPGHEPRRAVAIRDDRPGVRREEDRAAGLARGPVQRPVRRQDDVPRRDARHGRAERTATSAPTRRRSPRSSSTPPSPRSTRPSRPAGSARSTGNSYIEIMAGGDAVLAMAWSGDILRCSCPTRPRRRTSSGPSPNEGGMLWTDNMAIPKGVAEPAHGRALDRLLLRPGERGDDRGVRQLRLSRRRRPGRHARGSTRACQQPADLPAEDWLARLHQFRATTAEEEIAWTEAFTKVMGL